jgi:hypothetical protein
VKSINKIRNYYLVFFVIATLLTLWFALQFIFEAAFIFGNISIVLLLYVIKQSRLMYDTGLIYDNCIFKVPSATVSTSNSEVKLAVEEIVVSAFGLIIGNKLYKWGYHGAYGVKLKAIEIDRERVYLTFGDTSKTMRVELLHGITTKQEVLDIKQKFWRETGIDTVVNGW